MGSTSGARRVMGSGGLPGKRGVYGRDGCCVDALSATCGHVRACLVDRERTDAPHNPWSSSPVSGRRFLVVGRVCRPPPGPIGAVGRPRGGYCVAARPRGAGAATTARRRRPGGHPGGAGSADGGRRGGTAACRRLMAERFGCTPEWRGRRGPQTTGWLRTNTWASEQAAAGGSGTPTEADFYSGLEVSLLTKPTPQAAVVASLAAAPPS